jgi:hypothetical protein
MAERTGHTITGEPAPSERSELRAKGKHQRNLKERTSQRDDGTSNHPVSKETGYHGESNAGEDLTSGSD